ncbi:MAG TPA: tetratricopeptide repeat protein [Microvirga sp.]
MRLFASTLLVLLALAPLPAVAQGAPDPKSDPKPAPKAEESKADPRRASLDDLFERLGKATDEQEAKGIAGLIERRWARSGSDTADLLMSRAGQAVEGKDYPLAIELLDRVLVLEPQWVEAWFRRANVFFLMDDPVSSLADLRQVINREPRHFGAWAGIGHIFNSAEDKTRALESYRRSLKIYPKQSSLETIVGRLAPQVDGQDL